jgi:hypothetical protein
MLRDLFALLQSEYLIVDRAANFSEEVVAGAQKH